MSQLSEAEEKELNLVKYPLLLGRRKKLYSTREKDTGTVNSEEVDGVLVKIRADGCHGNEDSIAQFMKDGVFIFGYRNMENPKYQQVRDYIDRMNAGIAAYLKNNESVLEAKVNDRRSKREANQ